MADPAVEAAHDAALQRLASQKALCTSTCGELDAEILALDEEDRHRAAVAHHIMRNPEDAVTAAFKAGRLVDPDFVRVVQAASDRVKAGEDVHAVTGADPKHTDLLEQARVSHDGHRAPLEQAYSDHATARKAVAAYDAPSTEEPAVITVPRFTLQPRSSDNGKGA